MNKTGTQNHTHREDKDFSIRYIWEGYNLSTLTRSEDSMRHLAKLSGLTGHMDAVLFINRAGDRSRILYLRLADEGLMPFYTEGPVHPRNPYQTLHEILEAFSRCAGNLAVRKQLNIVKQELKERADKRTANQAEVAGILKRMAKASGW